MKKTLPLLCCLLTAVSLDGQQRYSIVMSELMVDPLPAVGLPSYEWIELKNNSPHPVNLQGWRIQDASGQSGPMPSFTLEPDSFVIICGTSALPAMQQFGPAISVGSFPSLSNDGELLSLKAAGGQIIHAVEYASSWYSNDLKKEGGWSLEMIDAGNPCGGSNNWTASTDDLGGTPGRRNAVTALNADTKPPLLQNSWCTDSIHILLKFDEPVDSSQASLLTNYSIDGGLAISSAELLEPLLNKVMLTLSAPMAPHRIYSISMHVQKDCSGNPSPALVTRTGIPGDPEKGDWVINEILFNPRPSGYDYVEFLNNSPKILDASRLYVANRNSSGDIASIRVLSTRPFLIFPGDHVVVTEDAANLALQYLVSHPSLVIEIDGLPSFPDTEGRIVALNLQGTVVDELAYYDDWHFKLLANEEGVALERIRPESPTLDKGNWHSAAATAGYGTPTARNSQWHQSLPETASITVSPKTISPDNDGRDDFLRIQYSMEEQGYVANIVIFDAGGRPVRQLVRNDLLGRSGYWQWDGLDDRYAPLPLGIYIIYTEIFNLQGKRKIFKNPIVVARPLK